MNQSAIAAVGLYAALNMVILLWLAIATARLRNKHRVWIGTGGVEHLTRTMRGHANAIENIPMTIILLLIAALLGMPVLILHVLGATFTLGRAIHAWHFIDEHGARWQRVVGFGLSGVVTVTTLLGVLGYVLWLLF
ncbi:MAPEG family protein [Pseudaminobacter sp. NGMCC 1.201702]|uniref:MAPEG family protein n=1 Tax=Pseudaminobacter sp. NGMCC 1.201702 TaxID=3391825 RepID=UPI0039F05425